MDRAEFRCPECGARWVYLLLTRQEKCPNSGCLAVLAFDVPVDGMVSWRTSDVCGPFVRPAHGTFVLHPLHRAEASPW